MHEYMKAGIVTSKTTSLRPAIMRPGPSDCQQISADGYKSGDVTIQRKSHGFQLNRGKKRGYAPTRQRKSRVEMRMYAPLTSKPSFFLANLRMKWWIWGGSTFCDMPAWHLNIYRYLYIYIQYLALISIVNIRLWVAVPNLTRKRISGVIFIVKIHQFGYKGR